MWKLSKYIMTLFALALIVQSCSKDPIAEEPEPEPPVEEQIVFPKKEMRAAWIATVWGLDWPQGVYHVENQKQQYVNYLDRFQELNMNAIFFQIKGMGDAFYASSYEPWSLAITGTRGKDPGYDVLKFMIDEAHARGIEFHAWLNPYRIATRPNTGSTYPDLHSSIPSEWVVSHEKIQIYNPAVPEVRQRLADIVRELIVQYDVDGIHFDDYFYPAASAAGNMVSDQADYVKYGAGYNTIQDFRRGNVDKAIEIVHNVIVATKPEVVFSVSPAPNRDYNYNTLFADVAKWTKEGWIDVVMPQLYQEIGNQFNDFQTNLAWWTQNSHNAALMVGYGYYKFGDPTMPSAFQTTVELQRQMDMTRRNSRVQGHVMYSAKYIIENKIGITGVLSNLFKDPAVMPFVGRGVAAEPGKPSNVRLEGNVLRWDVSPSRSVVYHFSDLTKVGRVVTITDENSCQLSENGFYTITHLNADNKESEPSVFIEIK